jgi:hypothetical protein
MRSIVVVVVVVLIIGPLVCGGCSSRDPTRAELARIYHVGMTRADVAELHRKNLFGEEPLKVFTRPAGGWGEAADPTYRVDVLLTKFERERGLTVVTCEIRDVPRGFMGLGVYWDYIWFDEDDRLLGFRRRVMD